MSKLSYEDKINIYNNKKEGMSIKVLSKKYDVVIDKHGYEVLSIILFKNTFKVPNKREVFFKIFRF